MRHFSREVLVTAMALGGLAACGPERYLFDGLGKKDSSHSSVSAGYVYVPGESTDKASSIPDCTQPDYAGQTCFDEQTLRFGFDTAGTALAPAPGTAAASVSVFVDGGEIRAADNCLVRVADADAAAVEPGALLTVRFDAPLPPDEAGYSDGGGSGSGGSVSSDSVSSDKTADGKLFDAVAYFKYACNAAKVVLEVDARYGQPKGSAVHLTFRAPAGTATADSPVFVATGAKDAVKDLAFASHDATAVAPSCQGAKDPLTPCYDEKTLDLTVDLAATGALAPTAGAAAGAGITIDGKGISSGDACLAAAAGANDLGRLTVSLDAVTESDGKTSSDHSFSASFYYSCDVKSLVVALSGLQKLGELYAVSVVFAGPAAGFDLRSLPFRAAGAKDGTGSLAAGPLHSWK